ncbi:MFS family permease [Silvibacterium bohemicum]|uniref:MFS family permease n=1 Tax=Silvibacterium bohemicum TaxID=1577686 RepID=A0A841JW42_9BACT|nr:OFA family MFS transporter [Silvibacterium bohemicum]MBB6142204.1 MFS family permease [Silvibacterium bohemicum]
MSSFLDREFSVARPGFNRWLVPPAALSIHLAIGQVYSFSVFKNPLLALKAADGTLWSLKEVGYIFSIAIAMLGLSAALFGKWLETAGPRKAMFVAACCFGSGFMVAAAGAATHTLALIYLGYGVIGGVGLGMGYISPVSTLIKWFPDRPGLATGLAIMGFGGGAMIGSPLGTRLMVFYKASAHPIAATWVTMGILYFIFMMFGVFTVRVPPGGWKPQGWVPKAARSALISSHNVDVNTAFGTPQFWLLWVILLMNVTAGIGILEQASPMIQDLFHGHVSAIAAAGFVGVLSLFNMGGRFIWASTSDFLGRKPTYMVFFTLGLILYLALPYTGTSHLDSVPLFVLISGALISMYGGGFATIPAYLKDLFGVYHVSAIHGRLLTAWSTAGIVGPLIVNGILDHYVANHLPKQQAYPVILHIMAGLMVVGFIANLLVRPVAAKHWLKMEIDPSHIEATH